MGLTLGYQSVSHVESSYTISSPNIFTLRKPNVSSLVKREHCGILGGMDVG